MSTLSKAPASTGTGAGTFDAPQGYHFGSGHDSVDRTPLNLEEIPDLGLGAVLRMWDDTLSPDCLIRPSSRWAAPGAHRAGPTWAPLLGADLPDVDTEDDLHTMPVLPTPTMDLIAATMTGHLANVAQVARVDVPEPQDPHGTDGTHARLQDAEDREGVWAPFWGPGNSDAHRLCRLKVGPVTASRPHHQALWVLLTGEEVHQTQLEAVGAAVDIVAATLRHASATPDDDDRQPLDVRPDEQSAVEVVADLQRVLGVPAASILRASGISRRSYQHWKATGATPRLSSQARLWDLALTARGWADVLGEDLAAWIRSPERLQLLDDGQFDALSGQVLNEQARHVTDGDWHRDRLAAGYFESVDAALEPHPDAAPDKTGETGQQRQPRRARRAYRTRPADGARRSAT